MLFWLFLVISFTLIPGLITLLYPLRCRYALRWLRWLRFAVTDYGARTRLRLPALRYALRFDTPHYVLHTFTVPDVRTLRLYAFSWLLFVTPRCALILLRCVLVRYWVDYVIAFTTALRSRLICPSSYTIAFYAVTLMRSFTFTPFWLLIPFTFVDSVCVTFDSAILHVLITVHTLLVYVAVTRLPFCRFPLQLLRDSITFAFRTAPARFIAVTFTFCLLITHLLRLPLITRYVYVVTLIPTRDLFVVAHHALIYVYVAILHVALVTAILHAFWLPRLRCSHRFDCYSCLLFVAFC